MGGGVGTFGFNLACALAARGTRVLVVTRRESASLARHERFAHGGVVFRRVPPSSPGRLGKYLMVPALFLELLRLRRQYEVIYLFGLRVLGPACVAAAHLAGKPCVLRADVSGEVSASFIWERVSGASAPLLWILRRLVAARDAVLRRADCLVSISGEIYQEYLDAGIDPAKVERIPNGVDVGRFVPADAALRTALRAQFGWGAQTVFLFTGRLHPIKGIDVLLRAWRRLVDEVDGVRLVLVGSGEAEHELRAAAAGLDASVSFLGQAPDVLPYLQAADAFVLPSRREGFSISLLEAAAAGLPVIATRTSGTVEIIADGQTGRLVEVDDDDGLCEAMKEVVTHPDAAKRMAKAGREAVRSRYSIEVSAARHAELFERVRRPQTD